MALKTEEEVIQEVLNHPERLSSGAEGITKGEIVDCALAYYVDGTTIDGEAYVYPVYVLTGVDKPDSAQSNSASAYAAGEERAFDIIVDAVER